MSATLSFVLRALQLTELNFYVCGSRLSMNGTTNDDCGMEIRGTTKRYRSAVFKNGLFDA